MKAKWIVALFALLMATGAMAQSQMMKSLDKNDDGMISEQEAAARPDLAKEFQKYDKNGDGSLEEAEFSQFECHAEKTCP